MSETNNLRKKYHMFMREFVDNKYLKNFENVKVLGERFISHYYVVVFHSMTKDYIIVENINSPVIPLDLQASQNSDGYIVTKQSLLNHLPEKLYKKLIVNGIFETLETANNTRNSPFGIHRLVLSLYNQCLNYEVHHIDFRQDFNAISNLINMIKPRHDELHRGNKNTAIIESIKEQNKLKLKLASPPKNTLAENLIPEILKLRLAI